MRTEHASERWRDAASECCEELVRLERPLAIFLVGSSARGLRYGPVDIDIAAFFRAYRGPQLTWKSLDGFEIGVERYDIRPLLELETVPLLDLKALREAGRLTQGELLYAESPSSLDPIFEKLRAALLRPEAARELLADSAKNLIASRVADDTTARVWHLQNAFTALARLALSFAPVRYQKPKWVVHDLLLTRDGLLLSEPRYLFEHGAVEAATALSCVRGWVEEACRLAGLPGLGEGAEVSNNRSYVRRTLNDAQGLLKAGDHLGCRYTACIALHLTSALIQSSTDVAPGHVVPTEAHDAWRVSAMTELLTDLRLCARDLDDITRSLQSRGRRLAELCRTSYSLKRDPCA